MADMLRPAGPAHSRRRGGDAARTASLDKLLDVAAATTDHGSRAMAPRSSPADERHGLACAPETASFDEACRRAADAGQATEHPLPTCFVCGPARAERDGLRIFAGPLVRQSRNASAVLAASWTPDPTLTAEDGLVAPEFLWSALDCPTGYASSHDRESGSFDRTPILLGRMSARIEARPRPGERCVITAWEAGRDGRKRVAEAAAYGEAGTLLAVARATWIAVDRQVQLGRA